MRALAFIDVSALGGATGIRGRWAEERPGQRRRRTFFHSLLMIRPGCSRLVHSQRFRFLSRD
jgi:hypothetical protein